MDDKKASARRAAIEANSRVWALLETAGRSTAETAEMIAAAHASHEHWKVAGGPLEDQRAHWLIARAYVDAGLAGPALHYARRTLALAEAHRALLSDFDLAFTEEVAARAWAAAGHADIARKHYERAKALGDSIANAGDRQEFFRQFALPPRFGLDNTLESGFLV